MAHNTPKSPLASSSDAKSDTLVSESGAQKAAPFARTFPTGTGQNHTHTKKFSDGRNNFAVHAGTPYAPITGNEIAALVKNPPAPVPKAQARWFIPSTYREFDARSHDAQRAHGQFPWLTLDVDTGNLPLSDVTDALTRVLGPCRLLVYSTSSATAENRKWRALVPLKSPLAGADFTDTQDAFFQHLADASQGALIADETLSRPAQLVYLPNPQTDFYQQQVILDPPPLNLTPDHPVIQRREANRAEREAAARAKPEALPDSSDESPDGAEVREILSYISPDCEYNDWLTVLMGLHHKFGGSAEGLAIADEWSAQGDKYVIGAVASKWAGFKPCGRTSFSSVADLARENGANLSGISQTRRRLVPEDFFVVDPPEYTPQALTEHHPELTALFEANAAAIAKADAEAKANAQTFDADPVDLWGGFEPPDLPEGLLPGVLEDFARVMGGQMGADPAGLAVAALVTCAAAIPDRIKLKVKRHADWTESARLWAALVGPPSAKKSPILATATSPLTRMDAAAARESKRRIAEWNALPKEARIGPAPLQRRLRIEDTTVEAAQVILEGSPDGVLCLQDELSGFFGAMDRYNGAKGASSDRAFWLRAFNGGEYALDRVGRGSGIIDNLSVSILGGIQPEPLRKIAGDSVDDGLLQRLFPIMLRNATLGHDSPTPPISARYRALVEALNTLVPIEWGDALEFSVEAQEVRRELEEAHLKLQTLEAVNRKLASHIGKYDGLFARLCLIWHCIEHVERVQSGAAGVAIDDLPPVVNASTARRVADFLHGFLLRHAFAFYGGVLGLSDDHERVSAVAGYILAHRKEVMTNRDVQRGGRTMRGLADRDIKPIFEQLATLGWLVIKPNERPTLPPRWRVNPAVHARFAERAAVEMQRRAEAGEAIAQAMGKKGAEDVA